MSGKRKRMKASMGHFTIRARSRWAVLVTAVWLGAGRAKGFGLVRRRRGDIIFGEWGKTWQEGEGRAKSKEASDEQAGSAEGGDVWGVRDV